MTNRENNIPEFFQKLISIHCLEEENLKCTYDGFFVADESLASILGRRAIMSLPDSQGQSMECSLYFDDWYLYALRGDDGYVYSLLKLREQEFDARYGDGDTPGVTVSFISFQAELLENCLLRDNMQNRSLLCSEINRVVVSRGQKHNPDIKAYFIRPEAQAPYLIAEQYVHHLASFAKNGVLAVPEAYGKLFLKRGKNNRIPDFLDANNAAAGRTVCDHRKIYLSNPAFLTVCEKLALLATHAGNTSFHSFAAEIRWHGMFLVGLAKISLPFVGGSVYASAIRADMTIDDKEFEGPTPYYDPDSRLIQEQKRCHPEYSIYDI